MTLKEYKQELYEAYTAHINAASLALDRYTKAKTELERQQAKIENREYFAICYALRWALDRASLVEVNND